MGYLEDLTRKDAEIAAEVKQIEERVSMLAERETVGMAPWVGLWRTVEQDMRNRFSICELGWFEGPADGKGCGMDTNCPRFDICLALHNVSYNNTADIPDKDCPICGGTGRGDCDCAPSQKVIVDEECPRCHDKGRVYTVHEEYERCSCREAV